jgi:ferrous iron transport protein A
MSDAVFPISSFPSISVEEPQKGVSQVQLGTMKQGQRGRIVKVDAGTDGFSLRLREMGFLEGSTFEILHLAPFGGDPMAVRIRGTLVAIRRAEANHVWVETKDR